MHTLHSNGKTLLLVGVNDSQNNFYIGVFGNLCCGLHNSKEVITNESLGQQDDLKLIGLLRELKHEHLSDTNFSMAVWQTNLHDAGIDLSKNWIVIEKVN